MNCYGENIKLTVFGQSHAPSIGVIIDGFCAGTPIDEEYVAHIMAQRAPGNSPLATSRREPDTVEFVSGVENGKTVGTSVCAVIRNRDVRSADYSDLSHRPRPSHADFPAMVRYGENYDMRGGGQFSGRLTAPICIAGAIALPLLSSRGIKIACHIYSVGNIKDTPFCQTDEQGDLMQRLTESSFPVIDRNVEKEMTELIRNTAQKLDSVGGVIECKITGLPVGVGEPMFCGVENAIAKMMFGIPAVKGIEFGAGFCGSEMTGSQYNDEYYFDGDGNVRTYTNNSGGICGGMTTGMPVIFRVALKPTPSISLPQKTVDLKTKENAVIEINGRHDPCIATRASVVVRTAAAFAVYDLLQSGEQ
ncbi:MAG: chorismate synthase [Clostridia bacterium]|nr:chorismate synthase [Clostridia bacterium]